MIISSRERGIPGKFIIRGVQIVSGCDTLVQLSKENRLFLLEKLKKLDNKWGMSLSKTSYVNSYQNDDYLFVAGLLQEVRDIHKKYIMMFSIQNGLGEILKFHIYS